MLLLRLCPTLSRPLDPGRAGKSPRAASATRSSKKTSAYACAEGLLRRKYHSASERYDNDDDGSRVKDDMEVSGRGVRSGLSYDCDSAARGNVD
jgi:hypothetical protein